MFLDDMRVLVKAMEVILRAVRVLVGIGNRSRKIIVEAMMVPVEAVRMSTKAVRMPKEVVRIQHTGCECCGCCESVLGYT